VARVDHSYLGAPLTSGRTPTSYLGRPASVTYKDDYLEKDCHRSRHRVFVIGLIASHCRYNHILHYSASCCSLLAPWHRVSRAWYFLPATHTSLQWPASQGKLQAPHESSKTVVVHPIVISSRVDGSSRPIEMQQCLSGIIFAWRDDPYIDSSALSHQGITPLPMTIPMPSSASLFPSMTVRMKFPPTLGSSSPFPLDPRWPTPLTSPTTHSSLPPLKSSIMRGSINRNRRKARRQIGPTSSWSRDRGVRNHDFFAFPSYSNPSCRHTDSLDPSGDEQNSLTQVWGPTVSNS